MRKTKKQKIKSYWFLSLLAVSMVIGIGCMMFIFSIENTVTENILESEKTWVTVGDAPITEGIMYMMFYPHQADPYVSYGQEDNLSNASAYEFSDVLNTSAGSDLPHTTTFDLVWKCAFPSSQAYNDTAGDWDLSLTRALMTGHTGVVFGETEATEINIGNGTGGGAGYMYNHYIMNNGGAGYTIGQGVNVNVSLKQQYYG